MNSLLSAVSMPPRSPIFPGNKSRNPSFIINLASSPLALGVVVAVLNNILKIVIVELQERQELLHHPGKSYIGDLLIIEPPTDVAVNTGEPALLEVGPLDLFRFPPQSGLEGSAFLVQSERVEGILDLRR